jgi:hypothetical protein
MLGGRCNQACRSRVICGRQRALDVHIEPCPPSLRCSKLTHSPSAPSFPAVHLHPSLKAPPTKKKWSGVEPETAAWGKGQKKKRCCAQEAIPRGAGWPGSAPFAWCCCWKSTPLHFRVVILLARHLPIAIHEEQQALHADHLHARYELRSRRK